MSDPKPRLVQVKIYDREYTIRTSGDPERLHDLCVSLDKRMREVARNSGVVDTMKVAILASLNIADEYMRTRRGARPRTGRFRRRSGVRLSLPCRMTEPGSLAHGQRGSPPRVGGR